MISVDDAKRQLGRVSHLPGFPKEPAGIDEMLEALRYSAPDLSTAKGILSEYLADPRRDMSNTPYAPTPQEIRKLGKPDDTAVPTRRRPICELCNGDGFVQDKPAFHGKERYEVLKRCVCDRQATFEDRVAAGEYRS